MKTTLFLLAAFALAAAGGCATEDDSAKIPALHKQAAFDLDCPEDQLQISEIGDNRYGVKGCHKRASYELQSCGPVNRECSFAMAGPVTED